MNKKKGLGASLKTYSKKELFGIYDELTIKYGSSLPPPRDMKGEELDVLLKEVKVGLLLRLT